jgi:hypothetical protein
MPTEAVDELEARKPEWLQNTLNSKWNWIQAVLRKRYDTNAMAADPPETVIQWLVDIVTKEAFDARGYDPSSKSDEEAILGRWRDARAEIKEAADSEKGLFELPLLATDTDQGVTRGGPLAYSEQSPYHWMAGQQDAGQAEDDSET